jgi:polyisoprenoid-binding protein YceI
MLTFLQSIFVYSDLKMKTHMKKYFFLLFPVALFSFSLSEFKPVDENNSVTFAIKNFGITTNGEFKGLKGSIKWDVANPPNSFFDVNVDVNTINTGIGMRDNDLKEAKWFDASKYSTINFKSTNVTATNVTGNLTIKGITKEVSFPYSATPAASGYRFEGTFRLNRRDFKVGGGSFSLSDNVAVTLKVYATQ